MDTQARTNAIPRATRLAPRFWLAFGVLAIAAIMALRPAAAQDAPELDQPGIATAEELQELVGPIALYPDDLVAIVLPASTYPLQVVQAARLLEDRKRDSSLKANEDWDDSIVALLNYPEVVELLNDDLDWTYDLGTAVLNQRADVLSAIQDFRDEAYAAGNLRSDERQTVAREDDAIEIKPADPKVIYVPYYEPERVVVYQPEPVFYYYPVAYPVYYYPYPEHYHFHTGFFWGVNTWFSIGWHSHYLHVYDPFYYGHPYYGWTYYDPFYVRNVYVNVNNYHYPNYVWQPRDRYGGRPTTRSSEGRVYTADRDRTPHRGALDSNVTRTREGAANHSGSPPPTRDNSQASNETHTPNGRSTLARPPSGRSTQANEGSNGRSTRAQTPPGQTHGQTHQPVRDPARVPGQAQAHEPDASADASRAQPSQGAHRSAGGMSQARDQNWAAAQPNSEARTSPGVTRSNPSVARSNPGVSQRASERSTGMPHESARNTPPPRQQPAPPQREAPPPRQQSFDSSSRSGGMSAQRSEPSSGGDHGSSGGGSYRGNSGGGNSGGGNSGGGHGGGSERSGHSEGHRTR